VRMQGVPRITPCGAHVMPNSGFGSHRRDYFRLEENGGANSGVTRQGILSLQPHQLTRGGQGTGAQRLGCKGAPDPPPGGALRVRLGRATGKEQLRLIAWGENRETSNSVWFNFVCGRPEWSYE